MSFPLGTQLASVQPFSSPQAADDGWTEDMEEELMNDLEESARILNRPKAPLRRRKFNAHGSNTTSSKPLFNHMSTATQELIGTSSESNANARPQLDSDRGLAGRPVTRQEYEDRGEMDVSDEDEDVQSSPVVKQQDSSTSSEIKRLKEDLRRGDLLAKRRLEQAGRENTSLRLQVLLMEKKAPKSGFAVPGTSAEVEIKQSMTKLNQAEATIRELTQKLSAAGYKSDNPKNEIYRLKVDIDRFLDEQQEAKSKMERMEDELDSQKAELGRANVAKKASAESTKFAQGLRLTEQKKLNAEIQELKSINEALNNTLGDRERATSNVQLQLNDAQQKIQYLETTLANSNTALDGANQALAANQQLFDKESARLQGIIDHGDAAIKVHISRNESLANDGRSLVYQRDSKIDELNFTILQLRGDINTREEQVALEKGLKQSNFCEITRLEGEAIQLKNLLKERDDAITRFDEDFTKYKDGWEADKVLKESLGMENAALKEEVERLKIPTSLSRMTTDFHSVTRTLSRRNESHKKLEVENVVLREKLSQALVAGEQHLQSLDTQVKDMKVNLDDKNLTNKSLEKLVNDLTRDIVSRTDVPAGPVLDAPGSPIQESNEDFDGPEHDMIRLKYSMGYRYRDEVEKVPLYITQSTPSRDEVEKDPLVTTQSTPSRDEVEKDPLFTIQSTPSRIWAQPESLNFKVLLVVLLYCLPAVFLQLARLLDPLQALYDWHDTLSPSGRDSVQWIMLLCSAAVIYVWFHFSKKQPPIMDASDNLPSVLD